MDNMFDLRQRLISLFEDIDAEKMDLKKAKEMNNTAGKIVSTVKCQMAYHQLKKDLPDMPSIDFIEKAAGK